VNVGELRALLEMLPQGSDDWTVTLQDSSGCVYAVAEAIPDETKRGIWLIGEANGFAGDHH
jgi:hypothetical protein